MDSACYLAYHYISVVDIWCVWIYEKKKTKQNH